MSSKYEQLIFFILVKRAMETIMFGNQQNSNKQVKKSDPSVPLRDIPDVKGPVLADNGGSVHAEAAEDLPETKPDNSFEIENDKETENKEKESTENLSTENEEKPASSSEEISPENQAAIDELTKSANDNSKESSEDQQSSEDNLSGGDSYGRFKIHIYLFANKMLIKYFLMMDN